MIDSIKISENANLICTFLELSIVDKRAKKNPEYHIPFSNIPCIEYDPWGDEHQEGWLSIEKYVRASETLFHSDWHWTMEVMKKVWSVNGDFYVSSKIKDIFSNRDFLSGDVEAVYLSCVKFIEWYNANTGIHRKIAMR